ncbi:facilitated trehalose transporter Tret1-like isoform X2 [Daphnia pulicaria]|uniref:facilitated trehalose transporter Tret1-like isoform X2 n=1 Tax=Daphnia pulicaria TaxID=35523 RepID=UPI001EEAB1F2|nr:facilitated trehalose transporter Tret1-like isoform X2 [Daphnia pulicaria]
MVKSNNQEDDDGSVNDSSYLRSGSENQNSQIDYKNASKGPQIKAAIAGAIGAFILGNIIGWSSPVQPQLQQNSTEIFNETSSSDWIAHIILDDNQMSWVGSLPNLGALFGALGAGFLMDKFGRRFVLMTMSLPYLFACLLLAAAANPGMLYAGRFIGGFAGGICSVVSPTYLREITMPTLRGILGMFFSTFVCSGILVTSLMGWLNWRLISAISAIFPVILFAAMFFAPESPYYLIKAAQKALKRLRGIKYNIGPEINQLEVRLNKELAEKSSPSDLIKPWALKPLIIAVSLMIFQQLSGINAAVYNSVAIFESAGSTLDNLVCAILLNLDQLVVTVASSLLVERLGRRTLFVLSELTMCISLFGLGTFFYLKDNPETDPALVESLGWLPLVSLILFIGAFGIGAGPVPWLMAGELLPDKVKGPGVSIATFTNWFLAFVVTKTFVNIQSAITSAGAFWMFGVCCVIGSLFGLFILPETKGKTQEEIQSLFNKKK